jgi:hypothetical protein
MADQASVKVSNPGAEGNGTPEGRVVGGIADFGNDIANLVDLQVKLAQIDLKECLGRATVPLALIVVALMFLLGAVPVALLGVAEMVAAALRISGGGAMFLTGGVVMVLALTVLVVAGLRLGPSFSSFRRTREELSRNLAWVRTVLLYSGRSAPRRRF